MARRRKVMGLPIGKKKPSMVPRALLAGAGLAAAVPAAVAGSRKLGDLASSGSEAVHKATGTAQQVADVAKTAGNIKEAVGQHSSTIGKVAAVVGEVRKAGGGGAQKPKLSHLIEEHTEIAVPRTVAYNQWTQFETFPSITKGAERVEQKERNKADWTSKIGPSRRSWGSQITEQVPDERISWRSRGGLEMKGVVTFHSLDENLTRVLVQIEYHPKGPVEQVGNLMRIQRRRVRRDLRLFKHFVELRGDATGAWRGRIAKSDDDSGDGDGAGRDSTGRDGAGRRSRAASSRGRTARSTTRSGASSSSPRRGSGGTRPGGSSRSSGGTTARRKPASSRAGRGRTD